MQSDALLSRIRAEYLEMPGLRLTLDQAQRLWGLERAECQHALSALVATRFLHVSTRGFYVRVTEGAEFPRARPAKATILGNEHSTSRKRPA